MSDLFSIFGYTMVVENDSQGKAIYVGEAVPGSDKGELVWRIRKHTYSGSFLTDIQWAEGNTTFNKEWDERATYSYS